MSTPLAISCPHCGAGLKLKNNGFVGKKVPCPKCKKPFLVEEPPEDEFLAEGEDDFGAMDEPEDEEPVAPRSQGKSKGGKGKKKSKSGGGFAPMAMMIGGIVLGVGLLGGIVYGAISLFSGGGSNSWVKWLPDETDIAIQVRVADSYNAPIFKPITDHPTLSKLANQPSMPGGGQTDHATAFMQSLGIQAKDIDTFTIGMVNGMSATPNTQPPFVAVIRLKTPVEESKLAQAPTTVLSKEDYNGKSVYAVVKATNPRVLVHSVDSTTYLVGTDAELKAAIDSKGKAPAASRFAFADDKSSLVIAAAPKDVSKFKSNASLGNTGFGNGQSSPFTADGMQGYYMSVVLGSDAKIVMRTVGNEAAVKANAEEMKGMIEKAKQGLQAQGSQMGGGKAGFNMFASGDAVKKLFGHVETMFGGAQVTSSSSDATLSMTLSGQIVADGVQLASPFMPMLEAMAKQQAAAAAQSATPTAPAFGSSPMDITAYPGAVINAGEKAKVKIGNIGDQHNADLEAQMQEGNSSSGGAATASNDPSRAAMEAQMRQQMQNGGQAAAAVGNPANGNSGGGDANRAAMEAQMRQQMQNGGQAAAAVGNPANGNSGGGDPNRAAMEAQMRQQMQNGGQAAAAAGNPANGNPGGGDANRAAMEAQMREKMQNGGQGGNAGAGGNRDRGDMEAQMRQQMQGGAAAGQQPAANGENGDKPAQPAAKSRSRRRSSSK